MDGRMVDNSAALRSLREHVQENNQSVRDLVAAIAADRVEAREMMLQDRRERQTELATITHLLSAQVCRRLAFVIALFIHVLHRWRLELDFMVVVSGELCWSRNGVVESHVQYGIYAIWDVVHAILLLEACGEETA